METLHIPANTTPVGRHSIMPKEDQLEIEIYIDRLFKNRPQRDNAFLVAMKAYKLGVRKGAAA